MAMLNIYLLGKPVINHDNRQLENHLSNKAIALISLLLLSPSTRMSREKLITYLWPDCDEDARRYNLRFNLWKIKKIIPPDQNGEEFIILDKECCIINAKYDFSADILMLKNSESFDDGSLDDFLELMKCYRGDFLEGMYIKNCDDFNDKIIFERIIYQKRYVELLTVVASKYSEISDYENEVRVLNELSIIEPYNEIIAYNLMNAYIRWGENYAAINYYRKFEANLKINLGISPSENIKELIDRIVNQSKNCNITEGTNMGQTKQKISIEVFCIPQVEYFVLSEIIRLLLLKGGKNSFFGVNKNYIEDLNYIQVEVGVLYEKIFTDKCLMRPELPEVRIVNSFIKAISHVSTYNDINIRIHNSQEIDDASRKVLCLLNQIGIDNFEVENIK